MAEQPPPTGSAAPADPFTAPTPAAPQTDAPAPSSTAGAPPAVGAAPGAGASDSASVEELLRQSGFSSSAPGDSGDKVDEAAIDELLRQASFEAPGAGPDSGLAAPPAPPPIDAPAFKLPDFNQVMQDAQASSIDLLRDVELNVKIELGRARMFVEDVLKLSEGSVVELDKLAGDPVDVFVNDRLVARGEVLVLNDNFCVRVNEIVAGVKDEGA